MSKSLWKFLIGCSILVITGCGTGQQNKEDYVADEQNSEIADEFLKEQNDLHTLANQEIHNINLKLTELNDKIRLYHEKGGKLTEAQNNEIDEIEKIRASINPRIHEINNVSQGQWENFKTTFENDIEQVKSRIDQLLNAL